MKVMVAALDWGLGHATRCIPVIRELRQRGADVLLGSAGESLALLRKEFPDLQSVELPAYQPRYPKNGSMVLAMLKQLPRFAAVVKAEHAITNQLAKEYKLDLVISDNRYGCCSKDVKSIIIAHQSNVQMPRRFGWLSPMVRKLVQHHLTKFDQVWIPDFPDHRLSGNLSLVDAIHAKTKVVFIGPLSRFGSRKKNIDKKYDVLLICSGPEPQRSRLENIVSSQLQSSKLSFYIVRGLPSSKEMYVGPNVANYLLSEDLEQMISSSGLVIARSGYSTIMDLAQLQKKAILVPTPGQTEQEYLAAELKRKNTFYSCKQEGFDLHQAMAASEKFSGLPDFTPGTHLLSTALDDFMPAPQTVGNFHGPR